MIWIDLENRRPTDTDIPKWSAWPDATWQAWLTESERLSTELVRLQKTGDILTRNALIDANSAHWGKLKPWLLALSAGKCWFSEARDIYSHLDVEHFRPKKEAKAFDGTVRDGYWWLAFDYMNFRACGNVGNRKKGGWFPLNTGSQHSTYDLRCEESESHYLLDPIDIDDVNLLAFDEEGKAIAAPGVSAWDGSRVDETIKRLKLNEHLALTEERKKVWQKMSRTIEQYKTAKARCNGVNPAAKQKVCDCLQEIKSMTRHDAELSAVAKWCVLFRNDPQLARLVA
ncbi:HNH endonuclease family protein [Methylovulum miyakonense]|uniref:hypothetical protein n=1 Tax=Methylovulum miyakonense TaxID=645578 RepID=UPI00037487A0|nr:hypothetical protein [Methylovulum miyakonense]